MNKKICTLQLHDGKTFTFTYTSFKIYTLLILLFFVITSGSLGYFYYQLNDYRSEASDFADYKKHKEEQQIKLQQLVNDNEKMLRDMAEISKLEKKLRRSIIHNVDSSQLGEAQNNLLNQTNSNTNGNYTGKDGAGKIDTKSTIAILQAQNSNIQQMLTNTKKSISQLLGEVEGSSGTAAAFPDKWPTDGGVISSSYGSRTGPIEGGYDWHPGIDIAVDFGTPVYATAAGTVEQASWNGGYGRYVYINHANGYATAYGHMSDIAVNTGQKVSKGEIIGFVGSTGYSTGPHLHYEVQADGITIDPFYVLKQNQ